MILAGDDDDNSNFADFTNVVAERRSYAHDASNAMFRRTTSLCLRFALRVMTQQNATLVFWGGVAHSGAMTPNSNSADIFVQCTYPQVSSSYVYSFGTYHVDTQTHKHTPPKTSNVLRCATTLGNNNNKIIIIIIIIIIINSYYYYYCCRQSLFLLLQGTLYEICDLSKKHVCFGNKSSSSFTINFFTSVWLT